MIARCSILIACAAAATLAVPVAARATTTSVDGATLRVVAAPGEANRITIATQGTSIVVGDTGPGVAHANGPGCAPPAAAAGSVCPGAGITKIVVEAGDLDDTVATTVALAHEIRGGTGADTLGGGPARDSLFGGDGADGLEGGGDGDALVGDEGADTLSGGDGDDALGGRGGPDVIIGGPGAWDTVDYGEGQHDAGVNVTIGMLADDGLPGEGDDVRADVEAVFGSSGPDTVQGTDEPNLLLGHAGDDLLNGRGGDDRIFGGPGDDRLFPGLGNDHVDGQDGAHDDASYAERADGVALSLDGVANDGTAALGEQDQLLAVEDLHGSTGADVLVGDAGPNRLTGTAGNDELRGEGGDDVVYGGPGADVLRGGAGIDSAEWPPQDGSGAVTVVQDLLAGDGFAGENDRVDADVENLLGTDGNDVLRGGGGPNTLRGDHGGDVISGGGGPDTLYGEAGDDQLGAVDGAVDVVQCGPGTDKATVDTGDQVAADCEVVLKKWAIVWKVPQASLVVVKGVVPVHVTCPAPLAATCVLDVRVERLAAGRVLGRATARIAAGMRRTLPVRLTRSGKTVLRRHGRLRSRIVVQPRGLARSQRKSFTVTLKAAR